LTIGPAPRAHRIGDPRTWPTSSPVDHVPPSTAVAGGQATSEPKSGCDHHATISSAAMRGQRCFAPRCRR
jgi:hypothetical protein